MDLRFDLLFRFLDMKRNLEEEQRKSAMSRIQSQALQIVLDKRRRRIDQLGALSSKICETIKKEREEKRKLQLQYCPDQMEDDEYISDGEESDERDRKERSKLFEDDEEGGIKLYVQNTVYKQIVLNVKDLKDVYEVTTDSEAENELTSLDSDETKKKKNKTKKPTKLPSKPDLPVPPPQSQPSKKKKKKRKKKKHNDSLSDDDPLAAAPALQLQRITLTEADIDTLIEDFDATHAHKLRRALEDLMRAQGLLHGDTRREEIHPAEARDQHGAAAAADDSCGVTISDLTEVSSELPSGSDSVLDESCEVQSTLSTSNNSTTTAATESGVGPSTKKKTKNKIDLDPSFDVNDVD